MRQQPVGWLARGARLELPSSLAVDWRPGSQDWQLAAGRHTFSVHAVTAHYVSRTCATGAAAAVADVLQCACTLYGLSQL